MVLNFYEFERYFNLVNIGYQMTTLNLDTIKNLFYADIVYKIHTVTDKIKYFSGKYNTDFETFENLVKTDEKEDFGKWDDYREWKGFQKVLHDLELKKINLENGNIKVA
jgi:hypothetical protein